MDTRFAHFPDEWQALHEAERKLAEACRNLDTVQKSLPETCMVTVAGVAVHIPCSDRFVVHDHLMVVTANEVKKAKANFRNCLRALLEKTE